MFASQMQHAQETWTRLVTEQLGRVESTFAELTKAEGAGAERATGLVDQWARLTRESIGYSLQVSEEWRKRSLEATRKAFELALPKL
jgi:hypothetical protein